ncbi:MAG: hypothetical protein ABSE51_06580 [Terracidiphilus sp.]|jgi:hypothetical protein
MTNQREFRFKIDGKIGDEALTPLTMPMARLAEYLADLAIIMGHAESVHFLEAKDGSHESVLMVEADEEARITKHIQDAAHGICTREANLAYRRLDNRLREDCAIADITNISKRAKILEFPGRNLEVPQEYGPIKERASLVGVLKRIGGFDESVPVHLQRADGVIFCCETAAMIAKQLYLFYEKTVRVHGIATYIRNKEGVWKVENFRIQSFDPEPLSEESFSETIEKLKAIPGNGWGEIPDPLEELYRLRHGGGSAGQ